MKLIFVFIFTTLSMFANDALVSAKWLNTNIDDKNIRIIEVSDQETYNQGHIPHAVLTSIDKWRSNNGTYLAIRSTNEIQNEMRRLGIDNNMHVVIYSSVSTPKDFLKASYVFWAMNHYGITNVSLLDGGKSDWIAHGYALSKNAVSVQATTLSIKPNTSNIVHLEYVKANLGKLPMIDARPSDKYLGITPTATVERDGHISGAMSYSWNYSVDKNYKLKPVNDLNKLFADGYKLAKDQEIIVYCTGGLETSFNYFVLSGVLGYTNIRLYDASMKEWGNRTDTPMTKYKYEVFTK